MQHKKFRLPGLLLKKQFDLSSGVPLPVSDKLSEIAVVQEADCCTVLLPPHHLVFHHPAFWLLAGALLSMLLGAILWRLRVLKQLNQLQNTQAILHVFNAELSREVRNRQQVEQKLRQSEAKLAEAQQVAHIGSWDFDLQTGKITWSREMFVLFDFDPAQTEPSYSELIQRIHPEDRMQWQQLVETAMTTGTSYILKHRVMLSDGRTRYIEGRGKAEANAQGQVVRLFGTGMDITERHRAEIALQNKAEQLRLALDLTQIGMWDWHIQSDHLFWNENTPRLLNLPLDQLEVKIHNWSDCVHPDDRAWVHQGVVHALEMHEGYEAEYRIVWQDGSVRWLLGKGRGIYNDSGQAVRMVGVILDITEQQAVLRERQQAEAALQQLNQELSARTRQLEDTNRELESFSYSVSHDLRAPSRHIHGFVNVLRQHLEQQKLPLSGENLPGETRLYPVLDAKASHYLDVIEVSSDKMGLLIDGLLTLSRVGRCQMETRPVALRDLVDEAIESARLDNASQDRGSQDSGSQDSDGRAIEFCIGDLPTVEGDAVLLRQVLFNLISNAIKFSRNAEAPRIEIGSLPDHIVFVRDNGIGFASEDAEQMFNAFQRLHGREFEGTGIGLAIVQRIIHRHNGKVWAVSQPHQGATFYFQLGQSLGQ